jgi:hypothetical protein
MVEYALPEPKREEAWFGDGNWCQIIKKKRHPGPSNEPGWLFILKPSTKAVTWYGLKIGDELDKQYGFLRRWYPDREVIVLNDDRAYGRTFIKTDLFGEPTNMSRENEDLKSYIQTLERTVTSLKASLARLHEEYDSLATQTALKLQRDAEILTTVRKGAGKVGAEDEENM